MRRRRGVPEGRRDRAQPWSCCACGSCTSGHCQHLWPSHMPCRILRYGPPSCDSRKPGLKRPKTAHLQHVVPLVGARLLVRLAHLLQPLKPERNQRTCGTHRRPRVRAAGSRASRPRTWPVPTGAPRTERKGRPDLQKGSQGGGTRMSTL